MDIFKQALNEVPNLESGERFVVKDLFKGYLWNRLPVRDRLNVGRKFFDETLNPYLSDGTVVALDKKPSGQQAYRKA